MPDVPDWTTPFLDAAILLPLLILFVRVTGLRTFAKMSAHDFVVTVATGSVVAATVLNASTPWWMGALALAALLAMQVVIGWARVGSERVQRLVDNEPLVLVRQGEMIDPAMRRARVTRDDLRQKLRGAGLGAPEDAALVVLETTGDVTVMSQAPSGTLMQEVRSAADAPLSASAGASPPSGRRA